MNLLRPRSLSALVLIGLAIFALPLVAALVMAGLQMRQADAARDRIITNGVAATAQRRKLYVQTMLLERQLRFYAVFMDSTLLESYRTRHERLADIEKQVDAVVKTADTRQT